MTAAPQGSGSRDWRDGEQDSTAGPVWRAGDGGEAFPTSATKLSLSLSLSHTHTHTHTHTPSISVLLPGWSLIAFILIACFIVFLTGLSAPWGRGLCWPSSLFIPTVCRLPGTSQASTRVYKRKEFRFQLIVKHQPHMFR